MKNQALSMNKLPITVVMLTLNEEFHLGDAIDNVKDWAEEIIIIDSLSTDRTVDIALDKGVKIIQRAFTNFGDQWNFALKNLPIKTKWTLKMDPDERLTEEVKRDIARICKQNEAFTAYEVSFRLWFMGKPLKVRLKNIVRLWQTGKVTFTEVLVNEHIETEGDVGKIKGFIEHYDIRDMHQWVEKQNVYTTMEAIRILNKLSLAAKPNFFGSRRERTMFIKKIFYQIPFRYQLLWLHRFFVRGAWRSGSNGFYWASARVIVAKMVEYKYKEGLITGRLPEVASSNKTGKPDIRVEYYD
ncbi:glycosyltransferase family 2 protein [Christiangramia sabulilitoris]|uniref:Glycosyltransferase family 2 protein n=1 Tax=Christiangramia sabulilitoris TaxID=2583991 RepID=A0A550HZW3_9FLAO|nr:glycosyltransferase family 2 protein [Christiangramia sabulilitoris]TRO64269.1 glycosyltransferase family 2 protein [Christiangramia sabulilitoris]